MFKETRKNGKRFATRDGDANWLTISMEGCREDLQGPTRKCTHPVREGDGEQVEKQYIEEIESCEVKILINI